MTKPQTGPTTDPTAPYLGSADAGYADPSAPVFTAPIFVPEPDPVFRDDALFASASANWRPPPPPVPVLDETGELVLLPAGTSVPGRASVAGASVPSADAVPPPPTPEALRDEAVSALKAPPPHYQAASLDQLSASRGGARSTYAPPPPTGTSRRPPPARPPASRANTSRPNTSRPNTWVANSSPTPTVPWRPQPAPATWLPQTQPQPQRDPGPAAYRAGARAARAPQAGWAAGAGSAAGRNPRNKGWIPGLVVLAFVVLANVVPHAGGIFHRGVPAGVDRAVNAYYTDVAADNVPAATGLVCPSLRPNWIAGQQRAAGDSRRGVVGHRITSTSSDGHDNYTVRVDVSLNAGGTGPTTATVKVLKQSGTYYVCGGTSP